MKLYKILLYIATSVGLLILIAAVFPEEGINIAGLHLRFPTIEQITVPKEERELRILLTQQQEEARKDLVSLNDSADYYKHLLDSGDTRFYFPQGNSNFFAPLFAQFDAIPQSGRTIRIVHYGDSQIEMDRLSSRLRAYMQRTFGGSGPGMVPFSPIILPYSLSHSASGALTQYAPYGDKGERRSNGNYGPLVNCHHLAGSASASFKASKSRFADSLTQQYSPVRLLFDKGEGTLSATLAGKHLPTQSKQCTAAGIHTIDWKLDSAVSALSLTLSGAGELYGVMLDGGAGVAVDNVPLRGCSGQQFTQIAERVLRDSYSQMDVGLIILQFGGNSMPYLKSEKSISTYTASIGRQIDRVHKVCPTAQILFIGPSDMSTSIGGRYQTYPYLPATVAALRDTAIAHGAAFWSLYDAMGGSGSMTAWVSRGLAGPDYIHYTQRGSEIMGDCLTNAFDNAYQYYRLLARIDSKKKEKKKLDTQLSK